MKPQVNCDELDFYYFKSKLLKIYLYIITIQVFKMFIMSLIPFVTYWKYPLKNCDFWNDRRYSIHTVGVSCF